jgi:signal transduction histidine kinase/CheY-like chemotaxis protein
LKLLRTSVYDNLHPGLVVTAHRELARRSPKVALSLVPMVVLVSLITGLHAAYPVQSYAATGFFLVLGVLRLYLARSFKRIYATSAALWLRQFSIVVLASSGFLGLMLPIILHSQGSGWAFIICLLATTGTAASATGSLSPHRGIFRAFVVTLELPAMVALLLSGRVQEIGLGVLVAIFMVQILVLGEHSHRQFWDGLRSQTLLRERAKALAKAHAEVKSAHEAKTEFLANMSHELRTPLNGILGLTDLVIESGLPPRQADYMKDVRASGQNLLAIVNEVMDFSRIENGTMDLEAGMVALPELLRQIAAEGELCCRANGNVLTLELAEDFPARVVGDKVRVRQILTNLVDNAVKFTKLGRIIIRGELDRRQDGLTAFTIHVQDTGIGIAPDAQKKIFKAFQQADGSTTRSFGGTGLGLAVSSRLATLMGGAITLESKPGQGSTFSLHLALPEAKAQQEQKADGSVDDAVRSENDLLAGLKLLMVEDNTVNAKLASRLLEKAGIQVVWAQNGQEGVNTYLQGGIDMVLMDIQMPVLDGFGATEAIRQAESLTGAHVPIIALTAHALEGYREKCLAAGMDDFLTKPLQPKVLRETLSLWSPRNLSPAGK